MPTRRKRFYTLAEYFELVRESDERFEYWDGDVVCMSGGKKEHVIIADNLLKKLSNRLADRNCQVFSAGMAIKVPAAPPFRYADVSAACGNLEFEEIGGIDTLVNPVLLIEVLSPTTEKFNCNAKFTLYKSIPSFKEYLLISQDRPSITQFVKQPDGNWQSDEIDDLESQIQLPSINCTLSFQEIYQGIDLIDRKN